MALVAGAPSSRFLEEWALDLVGFIDAEARNQFFFRLTCD